MSKDTLKEFATLQQSLITEKAALENRLAAINAALAVHPVPSGSEQAKPAPTKVTPKRNLSKRQENPMSLKAAILKVTGASPKTKKEIFDGVQKLGYRFGGKDPMNSINVILYSKNPKFKNQDGKFSVVK
jgi:hypothetical protein